MRSISYMKIMNMIRMRRESIVREIQSRKFECWRSATEIMCASWFVRGHIEMMHKDLDDLYLMDESTLTHREYKALDNYIDKLANYYWNLLYDKANLINGKILEGGIKL